VDALADEAGEYGIGAVSDKMAKWVWFLPGDRGS